MQELEKKIEEILEAREIIHKHMKNEEDILKFYYCESEDDYYLGQRVENMYYARYGDGAFTWFMSRYLPWSEKGYPSEPKEIPFVQWIEGFIRKYINDGWIPVEDRLPEEEKEVLVTTDTGGITFGYISDGEWYTDFEPDYPIAWRPLPDRPGRSDH